MDEPTAPKDKPAIDARAVLLHGDQAIDVEAGSAVLRETIAATSDEMIAFIYGTAPEASECAALRKKLADHVTRRLEMLAAGVRGMLRHSNEGLFDLGPFSVLVATSRGEWDCAPPASMCRAARFFNEFEPNAFSLFSGCDAAGVLVLAASGEATRLALEGRLAEAGRRVVLDAAEEKGVATGADPERWGPRLVQALWPGVDTAAGAELARLLGSPLTAPVRG